jgi:hypothetical protein
MNCRILHAAFAPELDAARRVAEKDALQQGGDRALVLKVADIESPDARSERIEQPVDFRRRHRIDRQDAFRSQEERPGALGAQQRLRHQVVARFDLHLPLFAAARQVAHPLPVFFDLEFERFVDGGGGQQAALGPKLNQIGPGHAAAQAFFGNFGGVADRRFEAGRPFGQRSAGLEANAGKGFVEFLLGVRPLGGES